MVALATPGDNNEKKFKVRQNGLVVAEFKTEKEALAFTAAMSKSSKKVSLKEDYNILDDPNVDLTGIKF